jgi:hypothetical protein
MTKILKRLFLLATVLAPIQASADTITVTATGYVGQGWDWGNVFGLYQAQVGSHGSMVGQNFTATYVFDTSLGTTETWASGEEVSGGGANSPATSATLTIGGITVAFSTAWSFLGTDTKSFSVRAEGDPTGGQNLNIGGILSIDRWNNATPYFHSSWDSDFSFTVGPYIDGDGGGATFRLGDISQPITYGDLVLETVTLTNNTSSVPGPVVGAGLPGLGAAALLWLARRRRNKVS